MIGSHTGGLLGSSQPSIQVHLSAATNIAAILVMLRKLLSSLTLCMFDTDKCFSLLLLLCLGKQNKTKRTNKIPTTMMTMTTTTTTTMSHYICKEKRIPTGTVRWQPVLDYCFKRNEQR